MTNPYIAYDPPGDTTNRTPKMLAGYKSKPVVNGEEPPPNATPSNGGYTHHFISEFRNPANMGPHVSGDEDVECANIIVDNSRVSRWNLQSHVITPGTGASQLLVRYSALSPLAWADGPAIPLAFADPVIPKTSGFLDIPTGARINQLLLKLVRRGGNGTLTPEIWNAIITAAGATSALPPGDPPSDLPQGIWGQVVFDANALGPKFVALGHADNDDLNFIPDETPRNNNLVTTATLLLPEYSEDGFSGGLPCFRWGGSSVFLYAGNPTLPWNDYTYYYVTDALDGGDEALLWGHYTGIDSFSYAMYFDDGNLWAANNNLFGGPISPISVDISVPHIIRWVKSAGSASWHIFVDGTRITGSGIFNAPGANNGGNVALMNNLGGVGASGHIGRVAAFNKAHLAPTAPDDPLADGLTPQELVLQGIWGTP